MNVVDVVPGAALTGVRHPDVIAELVQARTVDPVTGRAAEVGADQFAAMDPAVVLESDVTVAACGVVVGVSEEEAVDAALVPPAFVAVTVKV